MRLRHDHFVTLKRLLLEKENSDETAEYMDMTSDTGEKIGNRDYVIDLLTDMYDGHYFERWEDMLLPELQAELKKASRWYEKLHADEINNPPSGIPEPGEAAYTYNQYHSYALDEGLIEGGEGLIPDEIEEVLSPILEAYLDANPHIAIMFNMLSDPDMAMMAARVAIEPLDIALSLYEIGRDIYGTATGSDEYFISGWTLLSAAGLIPAIPSLRGLDEFDNFWRAGIESGSIRVDLPEPNLLVRGQGVYTDEIVAPIARSDGLGNLEEAQATWREILGNLTPAEQKSLLERRMGEHVKSEISSAFISVTNQPGEALGYLKRYANESGRGIYTIVPSDVKTLDEIFSQEFADVDELMKNMRGIAIPLNTHIEGVHYLGYKFVRDEFLFFLEIPRENITGWYIVSE